MQRLARDFGLVCGILPTGAHNSLVDVPGVQVGHLTRCEGDTATGFTAVLPHGGDVFREKVPAAVEVFNGFGKSAGLMQVAELGTVETPILLTNTFSVPVGLGALIRRAITANPAIGRTTGTVNPVVCECNDGWLNDIQAMVLDESDAYAALDAAGAAPFEQGSVGAGAGMSAFGFKGGIGTASRRLTLDGRVYHLGTMVLANFGRPGDLLLPDGRRPTPSDEAPEDERGSAIIVSATDIPLDGRQLKRVVRRCGAGLVRLGAFWGHGSGDIALGFTTAARIRHDEPADLVPATMLNEQRIDTLFRAAAESTQEAALNALCAAKPLRGRCGRRRPALADWLEKEATR